MKYYCNLVIVAAALIVTLPSSASAACVVWFYDHWVYVWESSCGEVLRRHPDWDCFTFGASMHPGAVPDSRELVQGKPWLTLKGKRGSLSELKGTIDSKLGPALEKAIKVSASKEAVAAVSKATGLAIKDQPRK